jgi:hypothetical protein
MRAAIVPAALIVAMTACAGDNVVPAWPPDPDAAMRPDLIVADPPIAAPSEFVRLTFPEGTDRGILFALDAATGDGWDRRYMLISDANFGRPRWFLASGDPDVAIEAIGIAGPGPDRILVPDVAPSGNYRICTANAAENFCVAIEIQG